VEQNERKNYWEAIYQTKALKEVGWYQAIPVNALEYLKAYSVPHSAHIIDVGGGDSLLVDNLLELGYSSVTVLDIAAGAIERAKLRLGDKANQVNWLVSDVVEFQAEGVYDFWYDRAAFHFLHDEAAISAYVRRAFQALKPGGLMVVGTFSEDGPSRCSGLPVKQYSAASLRAVMATCFTMLRCSISDHYTPSGHRQEYVYGVFRCLEHV
jgi:2-polyprenyl-3-methyl-5-hydroxy-6-metoxy-1,4-benzoquinol methylase